MNDSYSFTIHLQGNVPPPEPIGTPLTLATIVKVLADAAAQNAYYFFGRRGQTLFFDGLDSGNGSAMNIVRDGTTLLRPPVPIAILGRSFCRKPVSINSMSPLAAPLRSITRSACSTWPRHA